MFIGLLKFCVKLGEIGRGEMEYLFEIFVWAPETGTGGSSFDAKFVIIAVMCFIGASVVTRLTKINTSLNFSVNYMVMLASCLLVNSYAGKTLAPVGNELIASALIANYGMTIAGLVLLFGYRKSN